MQVEHNIVGRVRLNTVASGWETAHSELNTTTNNIKILNLAQRFFMANLCRRE